MKPPAPIMQIVIDFIGFLSRSTLPLAIFELRTNFFDNTDWVISANRWWRCGSAGGVGLSSKGDGQVGLIVGGVFGDGSSVSFNGSNGGGFTTTATYPPQVVSELCGDIGSC
ncbi:unnamed protein product [Fraxinus pennsylvanica]|uniref:Uncharacterized protein n=1 Tax=Fraxinus pennsylvanica TaxID=56036 RepID=A0AAD1ZA36_9LAMI|nr:unnamed protein product [Fraxinus pennsylvanica]